MTARPPHPDELNAFADLVAERVVELLHGNNAGVAGARTRALVDANEVARRFGVSPQWARQHADELHAVRLGSGPRARLRFDPVRVEDALTARSAGKRSQSPDRPQRRRRSKDRPDVTENGCPLLPVRGPKA